MVIWFLLQFFLTLISFIILIKLGDYGGGATGMTPLAVLLALAIQFTGSTILYLFTRKHVKINQHFIFILMNMILYELSYSIFSDGIPILNIFGSGFEGFISRCYSLSSMLAGLIILITFLLFKSKKDLS